MSLWNKTLPCCNKDYHKLSGTFLILAPLRVHLLPFIIKITRHFQVFHLHGPAQLCFLIRLRVLALQSWNLHVSSISMLQASSYRASKIEQQVLCIFYEFSLQQCLSRDSNHGTFWGASKFFKSYQIFLSFSKQNKISQLLLEHCSIIQKYICRDSYLLQLVMKWNITRYGSRLLQNFAFLLHLYRL